MRREIVLIGGVLLLIGCLFMRGNLSAQDNALVYVIDIRNEIGSGLGTYISDGIQVAENAGADAIVFDVDTPGGSGRLCREYHPIHSRYTGANDRFCESTGYFCRRDDFYRL